jgi:hypothetical protein
MSSKTIYTPYFYIIEHIETKMRYAGCKYAKDANPKTFLTPEGYCTSSGIVNQMIDAYGTDSFRIIQILLEPECGMGVLKYETNFLQKNNIAQDPMWFNFHNNEILAGFGSELFEERMMKKFGVKNIMQLPWFVELMKIQNIENFGFDNYFKTPEFQVKKKKAILEKYGVEHAAQNPEILQRMKDTCTERHGEDNYFKTADFQVQKKKTNLEKYGEEEYTRTAEYRVKSEATSFEKFGVSNYAKTEDFKALNSELRGGTEYWNNGEICKKFKIGKPIPDGWVHGMLPKVRANKRVINNGIIQTAILSSDPLPEGFVYGTLRKNFKKIHNGLVTKRLYSDEELPEGWAYGEHKPRTKNKQLL